MSLLRNATQLLAHQMMDELGYTKEMYSTNLKAKAAMRPSEFLAGRAKRLKDMRLILEDNFESYFNELWQTMY